MTLGRRICHKARWRWCSAVATWADGVRRNVDDKIVKPTSINHASVVSFCCCHVFGCCLNTDMCRTAPEALLCDHQACHSLWFSMRSTLCVTLMCCERSCRRPTLTKNTFSPSRSSSPSSPSSTRSSTLQSATVCVKKAARNCLRSNERNQSFSCFPNGRRHQTPFKRLQPARSTQGRKPASADLPVIASHTHLPKDADEGPQ